MQKFILTIGLIVLTSGYTFSQRSNPIVQSISDIPALKAGDKRVVYPANPVGYHLVLKGSDHDAVIDSTGRIVAPLIATTVSLYFQLINNNTDTIRYDVSKQVNVPGKYAGKGTNQQPFVIPSLREWRGGTGDLYLTNASAIVVNYADKEILKTVGDILKKEIREQTGLNLKTTIGKPRKGDIYLTLHETDTAIGDEGYYLAVNKMITISALKYQGLFWGTRTLLQLLEQKKAIPKGIARDYPEFKIRGFVLDDGRKFFSLQFLRDYVKFMSYYKMNDFQIHLSDNGFKGRFNDNWDSTYSAFRLENTTYPKLTAKDGAYTKKEFIALQKLANDYAVNIIPEIDVPAHALALTKAVPEIGSKEFGMDHLDLHNPLTFSVVENVFKEYLSGEHPVFMGKDVHIGTDEYNKKDAEAFRAFTDHFIKYVQGFGKNVRVWGALTHAAGTTPVTVKNVTMNTWYNGYANPIEMKKLGYKQISTPDDWLYIVPAAGYYYDYLDVKNIYKNWTPSMIGNISFPAGDPTIVGGSFAEWNDVVGNGISEKDVHDRVFPAMQVLSQKMWAGSTAVMSFDDFAGLSKKISEGPSLNLRGKIGKEGRQEVASFSFDKKNGFILLHGAQSAKGYKGNALLFSGKNSFAKLPYAEIGYDYTVSFWVNPSVNNPADAVIFKSPNSIVKLKQGNTGKLGFSRDGYNFDFGYAVPENTWTHIVIAGTNKGTSLYVNSKLEKKLYADSVQYSGKAKIKNLKSETLFFPLQMAGGFNGKIDELRIWREVLSDAQIADLK